MYHYLAADTFQAKLSAGGLGGVIFICAHADTGGGARVTPPPTASVIVLAAARVAAADIEHAEELRASRGREPVIKRPSPLNVLKYTYDHSYY